VAAHGDDQVGGGQQLGGDRLGGDAIQADAAFGPLLLARLVSNPRRPAWVFGPLLLRSLVDLALASSRSLG
jgi:hypothetical protein